MTTPYLGTFYFDTMDGDVVPPTGSVVEDITRPGSTGHAFRIIGSSRSHPFMLRTTVLIALNNVTLANLLNNYRAAIGTSVNLITPQNITWADCVILECVPVSRRIKNAIGPNGTQADGYLVAANWTLQIAG